MFLLKNTSYTLVGNVIFALSQWLILIILNKFGNSTDVGVFTYSLAITTPIFLLSQCGLRSYLVIDIKKFFHFKVYLNLRILLSIIALGIIFFICLFIEDSKIKYSILLISLFKLFDSIFDIYYGSYQRNFAMKRIAISRTIRAILNITFFLIIYLYSENLIYSLFGYSVSAILCYYFYDFNYKEDGPTYINEPQSYKLLLLSALPLGLTAVFISLNSSIPRVILENKTTLTEIGAFSSFFYLLQIAQIIIQSLCQAYSPHISQLHIEGDKKNLQKSIISLLTLTLFISFFFIASSLILKDLIFSLLFNKDFHIFHKTYDYTIYYSPLLFFMIAFGNISTALKKIKLQPYIFFFSTLLILPLSIICISKYNLNGAILAISISSSITVILMISYIGSKIK
ncbi:oligosaccharide flippase family protein [Proteus vulgaris]|uniref:lipopolysaccharide biosynthesis protein n=1 Tax=Proteus vulgaris TaxID=585 RepID=UPI00253FE73B|nr:oligosaccharide flippase family protein [Proteus vulgaris]WIF72399.1 oligosaccharide flippase family protein [Proteus vulgaris]